ncbi:uncharacterized protein EI97DRAFT_484287 [Westerdykella ornata]|uniref:Prion-inhibition and propagation HeLo domain-containing protein n=1 Tax=Westerdykella ornata TaxID=318751 RepID=A0A6A6JPX5_WESOR|nr:uncharacterized protein EI97DRAFT_484287 [Westerdykella ornata]KAF2278700.1 hypothetical protein EI97DRAFT_484287 [Westerdykella ornata]
MTEVAGLVLSVVALWKTCVEVFETVEPGRNYAMDYELLRVKLEVERIRLHSWGHAIGLGNGGNEASPQPDPRLQKDDVVNTVMRNTGRLQNIYGLQPSTAETQNIFTTVHGQEQPTLGAVFKNAYESLRRSARERQKGARITTKARWAIKDKQKFKELVAEIKGFNDNLESLFPESRDKIAEAMMEDVEKSENIVKLQLLQDVTAEVHGDISDCASARLDFLGAEGTARTDLLTVQEDSPGHDGDKYDLQDKEDSNHGQKADGIDREMTELENKMDAVNLYCEKKFEGALSVQVMGPYDYSSKVTTYCRWEGQAAARDWWFERNKGFVKTSHAAFALYKRRRFRPKRNNGNFSYDDSEESSILFDVESHPEYENTSPGTVTVEGFGLEAWSYEATNNPRQETISVNYTAREGITAKKLLRRIDELQRNPGKFGWDPHRDLAELREFTGTMGLLNRSDIFSDFVGTSSIGLEWNNPKKPGGMWKLLWQIILAKEVIRRFEHGRKDGWTSGFTDRVFASMIVADRWLKHVDIVLADPKITDLNETKPPAKELKAKAEDFKKQGNAAFAKHDYEEAIKLYTEAIVIDPRDAYIAATAFKLGLVKRAIDAYETAIAVAGKDATDAMRQGLAEAKAKNEADLNAIDQENDMKKREVLRKEYLEQDFEIFGKSIEIHSRLHEQQVEGLLYFAQKIKWPWINEVRDYCEEAYSNLRGGEKLPIDLHDWLFGMILPGKWFSFKIMAALVLSTASIKEGLGVARYYDCGLALPQKSYWRIRTVLGRVLGCTPGVISVCGWIGPCPPVEFIPPLSENKPCYVRLKARQLSLVEYKTSLDGEPIYIAGSRYSHEEIRIRPDEEVEPWASEIQDASNWVVPKPPVKQASTCEMKAIQLKKDISSRENDEDGQAVYRAQLVFKMDDSDSLIMYKLFTNPVFVTLPYCEPGPKGGHEVHLRELHRYEEKKIWTVEGLKDHTPEDTEETDVMIINATGKGAELPARAWCSERGKNAVIRRAGGPCFVCAERAASSTALGTGVLIWVS